MDSKNVAHVVSELMNGVAVRRMDKMQELWSGYATIAEGRVDSKPEGHAEGDEPPGKNIDHPDESGRALRMQLRAPGLQGRRRNLA